MIENTKCECGHQNPIGTVLCESCGKPLLDEGSDAPLEMRYDGVARRSQKAEKDWFDRVWSFFSSVKVAIYLILITLAGSALGTIFPQESTFLNLDPSTYYKDTYGTIGQIYYMLGLSHTYDSWWFIGLLFMIGTSLVVCSLDRVLPLYRALNKQQLRKHTSFLLRQKVAFSGSVPDGQTEEEWIEGMAKVLRKRHYRVHLDGTALLAEKHRFSRWGPYINHIGLIIFLLAVLARSIPGWHMDQYVGFLEGQTVKIPNTPYYLKNEHFTLDFYTPEEMSEAFRAKDRIVPKLYQTDAVLYECTDKCGSPNPELKEVSRQQIEVNKPLSYKGLLAYQFDYQETPTLLAIRPTIKNKVTGETSPSFELSMLDPKSSYTVGAYKLDVKGYFPDFALDDKGQPITESKNPNKPAFIFQITGPGLSPSGEIYLYFPRQIDKENFRQDDINGQVAKKLEISAGSMEDVDVAAYTSYLNIRVDRAMPYIWTGAAISMIGLIMGFYWQHRRIWLRIDDRRITLGAHTNKNWFGVRQETAGALNKNGLDVQPKSLETGVKRT
jgi:cytochrome c biogenesis protein